jgi:hypothetical protein
MDETNKSGIDLANAELHEEASEKPDDISTERGTEIGTESGETPLVGGRPGRTRIPAKFGGQQQAPPLSHHIEQHNPVAVELLQMCASELSASGCGGVRVGVGRRV